MVSVQPSAKDFVHIVGEYAKHYPYVIYPEIKESRLASESSNFPLVQIYLKQPYKLDWSAIELLTFEGAEFAEAAAQLLRGRAATASERLQFENDSLPWTRMDFILQLDQENRQQGLPVRVRNLDWIRWIWFVQQYFAGRRLKFPAQFTWRLFRKTSLWFHRSSLSEISMRQLLHITLASIEAISDMSYRK